MKIAILSYEGSTGRTSITRELFSNAVLNGFSPIQLACFDIIKPDLTELVCVQNPETENVFAQQPQIDFSKCRFCGVCAGYCPQKAIQFNRYIPSVTLIISMCFSCGKCLKSCDRQGITMQTKLIGKILTGITDNEHFLGGILNENSEFEVPLINALLSKLTPDMNAVCDFGPGIGSAINAGLSGMDVAVIVIQPEINWEYKLGFMLETLAESGIKAGVILNKVVDKGTFLPEATSFCHKNSIPLLGIIPFYESGDQHTNYIKTELFSDTNFYKFWNKISDLKLHSPANQEITITKYS